MALPRWLEDEWHERGWALRGLLLAALAAVGVVGWLAWSQWAERPAPAPAVVVLAAPGASASGRGASPSATPALPPTHSTAAAAGISEPPAPACAHQRLEIAGDAGTEHGCVSATQASQSGSIRTYRVDPEGLSSWQLTVDAVGERVVSLRLHRAASGAEAETLHVCDGRACRGAARLSPPDAHGARRLQISAAPLRALAPGERWQRPMPGAGTPRREARSATDDAAAAPNGDSAAAAAERPILRLSAQLEIRSDALHGLLPACPDPGVTVVAGQGATVSPFCPLGGAGFERDDDGHLRFVFRDLEGRELVVALGDDQQVESVSFGALACRAPHCGGLSMEPRGDPADPAVERRFAFSGTTLAGPGKAVPARTATLNGAVTMPSQQE